MKTIFKLLLVTTILFVTEAYAACINMTKSGKIQKIVVHDDAWTGFSFEGEPDVIMLKNPVNFEDGHHMYALLITAKSSYLTILATCNRDGLAENITVSKL
jgi:hypothetical protein